MASGCHPRALPRLPPLVDAAIKAVPVVTRLLDLQKRIEDLEGPKVMELASVSTSHPIYSWGHPGSGVGWRWGCT